MSVIWMCVQVQVLKESPAILLLVQIVRSYLYEWHSGQPSYFIKNGRNIECNTDNHIPLVVAGVQATGHRTKALDELLATTSYEWNQNYQNGFNHTRKD